MDLYQQVIYKSRYAKWIEEENRRETWEETVSRYMSSFCDKIFQCAGSEDEAASIWNTIYYAIYNMDIMPSMRCLMTAGKALDRDNVAGYNCAYTAIDDQVCFDEIMYILMCGTGVGFSVERQYINNLPEIAEKFYDTPTTISVNDSRIGWAAGLCELISFLYSGKRPRWNLSAIRERGARLITFGGRASGPEPLEDLFKFTINLFENAKGRKLNSIECHRLVCKIAEVVIVGGVRRSALLSLSNLTDQRMRGAKSGEWYNIYPELALANNSVSYTEKPDITIFMKEWLSLMESKSGERGIFNRCAASNQINNGRREENNNLGTNPCGEILLRPQQFCNLTEVIVRPEDTLETLEKKVELATILGTLQSTLTDFRYLRKKWKDNCEEERLLGVSLTGIMDHKALNIHYEASENNWLKKLKETAIETNKEWSKKLGINQSTAITCIKPSGTVSQLTNTSSGIHPRFSPFYIRRIRNSVTDPLSNLLIYSGVPYEKDVTNNNVYVFSFPIKSPDFAVTVVDTNAQEQLELWLTYKSEWCEHSASCTIYVKEDEWLSVGAWVYNNFNAITGLTFLPYSDHSYRQAPYEKITEEEYNELTKQMPKEIDWDKLQDYEKVDATTSSHELACSAGNCEI